MFELIKNNKRIDNIDSLLYSIFNNSYHNNMIDDIDYYYSDDDSNYYIELALPGLDKKDINLNIDGEYLFLNYEQNDKATNFFWQKSFKRRITLPQNINSDTVVAQLKNGILSIKIDKKTKSSNFKSIDIK